MTPRSGYVHDLEPGDVVSYLHRGASGVVRLPDSGLAVLSCERRSDGSWMLILEGWGPAAKDVDFNGHDAATYTTDREGPWNKCHLHQKPCPWCIDPNSEAEKGLCTMHEAERLGVTQEQLERDNDC